MLHLPYKILHEILAVLGFMLIQNIIDLLEDGIEIIHPLACYDKQIPRDVYFGRVMVGDYSESDYIGIIPLQKVLYRDRIS